MTTSEVKKIISELGTIDEIKTIRIMGGEPTLHPSFVEIIEAAKQLSTKKIVVKTIGSNTAILKRLQLLSVDVKVDDSDL